MPTNFQHTPKEKKIVYLIWLDKTILELWTGYLDIWTDSKLSFAEKEQKSTDKKSLIDYFEGVSDQIMKGISHGEIAEFRKDNSELCRNLDYDWPKLWL